MSIVRRLSSEVPTTLKTFSTNIVRAERDRPGGLSDWWLPFTYGVPRAKNGQRRERLS